MSAGRRVAGYAVLSLVPATLVVLAVLAGQLIEMAVGLLFAGFIVAVAYIGARLLDGDDGRGES